MTTERYPRSVRALISVLLAAGLGIGLAMPAGAAPKLSCEGAPATIVGRDGDDLIHGVGGDDVICGGGGDDQVVWTVVLALYRSGPHRVSPAGGAARRTALPT